ncbi:hypothetical protein FOA52_001548 [Chlamydomonas sp. UWO 241]|nr:hypothetical protein FOA52_001548 [Chlamydomonas sp. UWO 241]
MGVASSYGPRQQHQQHQQQQRGPSALKSNRVHAWEEQDEETGRFGSSMPVRSRVSGPVAEQVDNRPPSDQPSKRSAKHGQAPSTPLQQRKSQSQASATAKRPQLASTESGAAEKLCRREAVPPPPPPCPYALIKVDLHSVPSVDTENQKFTVDMDVKMRVYIPKLRKDPFVLSGCAIKTIKTDADGAIREPLELRKFPLDVQRLHVTYEFDLIDSLDKDVTREDVMERLWSVAVFDESRFSAAVAGHDDEWALCQDALEIYSDESCAVDKPRLKIVLIVKRRPTFYAVNVILPVWCIVLFAFIRFQFGAAELGERLQVQHRIVMGADAGDRAIEELWSRHGSNGNLMLESTAILLIQELVGRARTRDEEEQLFRRSLADCQKALGAEHPDTLISLKNLAEVLSQRGKVAEAEQLYRRAMAVREKVLGAEHPDTLLSLNYLAEVLNKQDKLDEEEQLYRRAMAVREKVLGAEHPDTLLSLNYLAEVLNKQDKLDEEEQLYRRAMAVREKVLGAEHPDTLLSLGRLAIVLYNQDKVDEAEQLYRRALSVREKVLGAEHPDTLTSLEDLAFVLIDRKQDEAEQLKIDDIIGGFNPIEIPHHFLPDHQRHKFTLKLYVSNPTISKPAIIEKDGSSKITLPSNARNRNFTYASLLHVDVRIESSMFNEEDGTVTEDSKKISNVYLGKLPIMVRSRYSLLNHMPSAGECIYDYGGYFVVNGNEKVVISQDRIAENKICVFINTKSTVYSHIAEATQFGRAIRVNIHHVKHDIPLAILFRALGIETDRAIVNMVLRSDKGNEALKRLLIGTLEEGSVFSCQRDAYEYLNKYMVISGYNRDIHTSPEKRMSMLIEILRNEFLPHVGESFAKKAMFLGTMACKLIKCYAGVTPFDDRDSYVNKRVDTPGVLLASLFRQYYGKVINDMKNMVNKELNGGVWKTTTGLVNVIYNTNVSRAFKSTVIESGMRFGLSTGNWGIKSGKNGKVKQGVAQVLNRLTYSATLSHLRRINTPVEKTGKLIQPRKLHGTQHGVICPAETPEGASVGLVKNMALGASITVASNSLGVHQALNEMGTELFISNPEIFNDKTVVSVNGSIVGTHDDAPTLYADLKRRKRKGIINSCTSIVWDIYSRDIRVCTDGGRCIRSFMLVEDGRCLMNAEYVSAHPSASWNTMCTGDAAVIEYLDVEEVNHALIASVVGDLSKESWYTHVEVEPSLLLGVLAASIPFSNHNQAPRNCYQSSMGKQAIGVYSSNYRKRFDTMGHILNYPQRAIVQTRVSKIVNYDALPCNMNVIVAIMTYTGFNQQDSEEFFCAPDTSNTTGMKPVNYEKLNADGFVPINTPVESGDVIIGKCLPVKDGSRITYKDSSVVLKTHEENYIDDIYTSVNGDGYTFAKVKVRSMRSPCIGNKFCLPKWAEVLTQDRGWVSVDKVTVDDYALQMDPHTKVAGFAMVQAVHTFPHDAPMRLFSGPDVHLQVTDEHRMVTVDPVGAVRIVRAKDLAGGEDFMAGRNAVDLSCWLEDLPCIDGIDRVTLSFIYGCFSAGGSVTGNTASVRNTPEVIEALKGAVLRDAHFVMVTNPALAELFRPAEIELWPLAYSATCAAFLDGVFQTESEHVKGCVDADVIQLMALKAGRSVVVTHEGRANTVRYGRRLTHDYTVQTVDHEGSVHCIEVPTGVFYVRMNGVPAWTGNSSRHGVKGTVGMIYAAEDMPFTKDGVVLDIIINPHAILSRMTIAQLMECLMGKAACAHGAFGNGSPFQDLSVQDIAAAMSSANLERHGNEIMYNPRTGAQMETDIFIGPTYYQRLKHMVNDKVHSRSSCGPVVLMTRQPAEGRARDGGLRLGEMEVECNWAHGISSFLKERFMECSDNYRMTPEEMKSTIRDVLKESVDGALASIQNDVAGLKSDMASASVRLENIEGRMATLEQVADREVWNFTSDDVQRSMSDLMSMA